MNEAKQREETIRLREMPRQRAGNRLISLRLKPRVATGKRSSRCVTYSSNNGNRKASSDRPSDRRNNKLSRFKGRLSRHKVSE